MVSPKTRQVGLGFNPKRHVYRVAAPSLVAVAVRQLNVFRRESEISVLQLFRKSSQVRRGKTLSSGTDFEDGENRRHNSSTESNTQFNIIYIIRTHIQIDAQQSHQNSFPQSVAESHLGRLSDPSAQPTDQYPNRRRRVLASCGPRPPTFGRRY